MNILFLYTSAIDPNNGGVQRVTSVLGNYFKDNGYKVFYLSLKKASFTIENQFYLPVESKFTVDENKKYFQNLLEKEKIDIVINQGALGPECSAFSYTCVAKGVKLISVIHNSPLASIINFSSSKYNRFKKYRLTFLLQVFELIIFKKIILWLYKQKYKAHYTKLIENSHVVLLLSDSFKKELLFFYDNKLPKTVKSISNPVSFKSSQTIIEKKEKIALYVGRVDYTQKRVDLLLQIWLKITNKNPEWKLKIVGEGPELIKAKSFCKKHKLDSVFFEGFKNPIPYYEEASILCMTSSFEGFPMVLVEAINFGVVPVAFQSFNSITDIITDKKNGILVNPFSVDEYVNKLSNLMKSSENLKSMASNAINDSRKFALTTVGEKWFQLFDMLKRSNED